MPGTCVILELRACRVQKGLQKGPQLFKCLKWKGKNQAYYLSQNQGLW